ncbi:unnamed protein product [Adineta ricciae]|uniref:Apple domain-containing protein n=1 Tax=Adineta ricciae TaxID=249248 RepID=A0A814V0Q0_ADIRI|nr:unnamed protein product [Adineta ricciae]CAF1184771.1 unnamed protein product [Adineta ricciae]
MHILIVIYSIVDLHPTVRFIKMNSSILAFVVVVILVISESNARSAKRKFLDEDSDDDFFADKRATSNTVQIISRCTSIIEGKDALGGEMTGVPTGSVRSAAACAVLCESFSGCDHWSFSKESGGCWLKDKPSQIQDNANTYTGTCTKSA